MPRRQSLRSGTLRGTDDRRHHFSILYHAVLDDYGAELKPHGLATYWALLRFASKEGQCYPSHDTIAERTGQSVASVKRSLKALTHLGLIRITMRRPRTSIYTIVDVPERQDNRSQGTSAESTINSSEGTINRSQGAINSSERPIEQLSVSYEVDVVEVDPQVNTYPTTPPPTPPSEIIAPISETVVEVVEAVAVAQGEEAEATDGHMAGAEVRPWRQFYDAYPTHRCPEKVQAEWDRQQLDASLPLILEALSWQQALTGHAALPFYPHVYLKDGRWRDQRPMSPLARWAMDDAPTGPQCKERECAETPGKLSDTRCDRHAMVTIEEEAARLLRALKDYDSEATIDVLEDAIWHEVDHYHKNGDWRGVMDCATSCYQSIGDNLYVEFLAQQIARVVEKHRAEHPKESRLAVLN